MNSFRLDRRGAAMRGGTRSVIVPGNSAASRLYLRLLDDRFGRRMPAVGGPLPPEEIAVFKAWIDQGAVWPDDVANDPVATPADPKAVSIVAALRKGDASALLADPKALNLRGPYGATPFMYAVLYSDAATVARLLDMGGDANARNDAAATPLMWAADDAGKTKALLAHGAKVDAVSSDARTPLLIAASQAGSGAVVKLLLEAGADPNHSSPLREAASRGDLESMRLLIAKGASPKAAGAGAVAGALERKCLACADLIAKSLDAKAFTPALLTLAVYSDPEAIKYVVDHGADVNTSDVDGRTPLMYAANNDRILLENRPPAGGTRRGRECEESRRRIGAHLGAAAWQFAGGGVSARARRERSRAPDARAALYRFEYPGRRGGAGAPFDAESRSEFYAEIRLRFLPQRSADRHGVNLRARCGLPYR